MENTHLHRIKNKKNEKKVQWLLTISVVPCCVWHQTWQKPCRRKDSFGSWFNTPLWWESHGVPIAGSMNHSNSWWGLFTAWENQKTEHDWKVVCVFIPTPSPVTLFYLLGSSPKNQQTGFHRTSIKPCKPWRNISHSNHSTTSLNKLQVHLRPLRRAKAAEVSRNALQAFEHTQAHSLLLRG